MMYTGYGVKIRPPRREEIIPDLNDGWVRVTHMCKANRRALWLRITETHVEFCAGRQGRDNHVRIPIGAGDGSDLHWLCDVIDTAAWGITT